MTRPIRMLIFCITCSILFASSNTAEASDHLDAPLVRTDGRTDINDIYAFQSPTDSENTVFIMTVNPFAGILSPSTLSPNASYDIMVDTDGDALEDLTFSLTFSSPNPSGVQRVLLRLVSSSGRRGGMAVARGFTGENLSIKGGGTLLVDLFDDPFFFDLDGFNNGLNFTGDDAFAGANVTGIVLEVPSSLFGSEMAGFWATTEAFGQQIDRMGRPAINTVLVPPSKKNQFNMSFPVNDVSNFFNDFVGTLLSLGNDQATAEALASVLLPDLLTFDVTSSAGFLNGRRLEDDVIDAELALLTGGAVTTDFVDENDVDFQEEFPFLAPPQPLP